MTINAYAALTTTRHRRESEQGMSKSILEHWQRRGKPAPTYEVRDEIAKLVEPYGGRILVKDVAILDDTQQELILDAIPLLEDAVANSQATHSPDYYRAMYVDGMPGFSNMSYEAQITAATVCVNKWRKENADVVEAQKQRDTAAKAQAKSPAIDEKDGLTSLPPEVEKALRERDEQITCDPTKPKKMSLVGKEGNIYHITLDGSAMSVSAEAFGTGIQYPIADIDLSAVENVNFAYLDIVEAADDWEDDPDFARAFPEAKGAAPIRDEAGCALTYAIKHMIQPEEKIVMPTDITRVMGVDNMANPEKVEAERKGKEQQEEMLRAIDFAKKHNLTDGDVMGAFFKCGHDWRYVIMYLKGVYQITDDEYPTWHELHGKEAEGAEGASEPSGSTSK